MFVGYEIEVIKTHEKVHLPGNPKPYTNTKPTSVKVEIREVYDDHSVVVANLPVKFVQTSPSNDSDCFTIGIAP